MTVEHLLIVENLVITESLVIVEGLVVVKLVVLVRLVVAENLAQDLRWNHNCRGCTAASRGLTAKTEILHLRYVQSYCCPYFCIVRSRDTGVDLFWISEKLFLTHFRGGSRDSEKGEGLWKFFGKIFWNFLHFYIQWKLADEILSIFQNLQMLL